MTERIRGLHHITALASDPQTNLDFYSEVLGLSLVKQTVNFDDPGTYHLYYGDQHGSPGSILTFFPWPRSRRGVHGTGQATVTSFAVPAGSLGFWHERLRKTMVGVEAPSRQDAEERLRFLDPDGLKVELVEVPSLKVGEGADSGPISAAHALRRFRGLTATVADGDASARFLTEVMGLELLAEDGPRRRFDAGFGAVLDLEAAPRQEQGRIAAGTVHHVAWRVPDDEAQLRWRQRLLDAGANVSAVKDRQYFHSIYFREPGGILFEIATDPPGFTLDEAPDALGQALRLPPWLEPQRDQIQTALPALRLPRPGAA